MQALAEYYEKHGDGNPNYTLEQFNNAKFLTCPAFFRPREFWETWIQKNRGTKFKDWDLQLNILLHLSNKYNNLHWYREESSHKLGGPMTSYAQKIRILSHFNDKNASNREFRCKC